MSAGLGSLGTLGSLRVNLVMPTKGFEKDVKSADKTLAGFETTTGKRTKAINAGLLGIGAAVVTGVALAVRHFGNFEKSMKNVQAVSGATAEEFDRLKNFAIEMGSTTAFTAKEAGDAMYFLASAGLSVADQMKTTASVLDLAAATQTELADSSRIVVNTLSGFTLEAEQSRRVADVFAQSIATSQASMSKLGAGVPVVAATMNDLGISLESTVTGLSLLFDKGIRAERAATGLRNAMKRLIDPTDEAKDEIARLGLTIEELDPRTNSLVDIIGKLEQAGFDTAASIRLFGLENDAMNLLVATGAEKFREFESSLRGAAGAAETMKDVQLDSFSGSITLLTSAVDGFVISFGENFAPIVRTAADALTGLVTQFNKLGDTTKTIIAWTTAIGGVGAGLVGGLGLLGAQLPNVVAGFAALSSLSLGPVGIAIAAVAGSIAIAAVAFDEFKKSSRDVFIGPEMERQKNNIEGIANSILELEKTLDALETTFITVKEGGQIPFADELFLIDKGIINTGNGIEEKFIPAIERMKANILAAKEQLFRARGGLGNYSQAMAAATTTATELNKEVGNTDDVVNDVGDALDTSGKLYKSYYEFLLGEFDDWVSITGKGFNANEKDQAEWLDSVLETVEKDSKAWRGLTNKRNQLMEQWIIKAVAFEKKFTTVIIEETAKREETLLLNTQDHNKELRAERDRAALDEITTEIETAEKKIVIQQGEFEVREKIADDGNRLMDEVTQAQINAGNTRGEGLVAEQEKAQAILMASQVSWGEFGNTVGRGMNAVGDAYLGVVDVWRTLRGDQREFHDTWITGMVDWVNRIKNLMNSVITIWRDATTIISKLAQVFGGGDSGGVAGTAAGLAPGIVGSGAGIGATVGKIGAGVGTAAGAVGSAAGTAAGFVAPALPLLGPLAAFVGAALLINKFARPDTFTDKKLAREDARRQESRAQDVALQQVGLDPVSQARQFALDIEDAKRQGTLARLSSAENTRAVSEAINQSNVFLAEIAANTRSNENQNGARLGRRELGDSLWELIGPSARAGGYI